MGNLFQERVAVRRKLREAKLNRNPEEVYSITAKGVFLGENGPYVKEHTYLTTKLEEDLKAEDTRLKLLNNCRSGAF